jgi:dihydrofolate reductase
MPADNQKELPVRHNIDLSLVVAMTPERVIGRNTVLPWHLPSDLERFRAITTKAGTVVMGRITHESILSRNSTPLPERHHIVLTRKPLPVWMDSPESVTAVASIEETLALIKKRGGSACVIGGAQIYEQFFPFVRTLFVTTVYASIEGDAFFLCPFDGADWKCTDSSGPLLRHARDDHKTSFDVYQRVVHP